MIFGVNYPQGGEMNKILSAVLAFAFLAFGLSVSAHAVNTCSGYQVSQMCVPAQNILEGPLATGVQASGVGVTTSPVGVAITYGLSAGSVTVNGVGIINAAGQIPAINSTYFTSLSGAALTALTPANVTAGDLPAGVTCQTLKSASLSTLSSTIPSYVGQMFYISNGSVDTIAIATQTVTASWQGNTESRASGGAAAH